jgi:hypothetical protein
VQSRGRQRLGAIHDDGEFIVAERNPPSDAEHPVEGPFDPDQRKPGSPAQTSIVPSVLSTFLTWMLVAFLDPAVR